MQTTYKLKADELNNDFLNSVKILFHGKVIEIAVSDAEPQQEEQTSTLTRKAGALAGRIKMSYDFNAPYQILLNTKNEVITGYPHFALVPGQYPKVTGKLEALH